MEILYLYDINAKNKKEFNRTKRMFYYYLNQLDLKKDFWKTKSALCVSPKLEKSLDLFFKRFKGFIKVYKIYSESIEEFL